MYVQKPEQHHTAELYHDPPCTMTIVCGLPGSGKSTWSAAQSQPTISLDALRTRMGIRPEANQGRVVQAAREAARVHLRAQRDFIWDATNLTRRHRAPLVALGLDYGAQVELVSIEATCGVTQERNRARAEPVPGAVWWRMLRRWEPPTLREAHTVRRIDT